MTDTEDRLIELLDDTLQDWECDVSNKTLTEIAEHLSDNGVIAPPCKVGDAIYKLLDNETVVGGWSVFSITVYKSGFVITDDCGFRYANDEIGKEIFFNKEEAQKALERSKG